MTDIAIQNLCIVAGCESHVLCKGLCVSHYQKKRIYGTTDGNPVIAQWRLDDQGYISMRVKGKRIRQHVHVVEQVIGRKLPKGASVHHVNGIKTDNRPENLVVCQSEAYHQIIHRRQRAHESTGDASKRQCVFCHQWGSESEITVNKANSASFHASCRSENRRANYAKRTAS